MKQKLKLRNKEKKNYTTKFCDIKTNRNDKRKEGCSLLLNSRPMLELFPAHTLESPRGCTLSNINVGSQVPAHSFL